MQTRQQVWALGVQPLPALDFLDQTKTWDLTYVIIMDIRSFYKNKLLGLGRQMTVAQRKLLWIVMPTLQHISAAGSALTFKSILN